MSAMDDTEGAPIAAGTPLARALDDFAVPELPEGFADKVLAAAAVRPAPLPQLRRSGTGMARGWRIGRRIAIGVVGFSALATAAAATGLLERVGLPVPSPEKVWASITGTDSTAAVKPPAKPAAVPADAVPAALAPVRIEGAIDTPEELGEAFRRIDEVREGRSIARRQMIEQRIAKEKERRAAAGLPLPTPEQEARIRQRIDAAEARRESLIDQRLEVRREELRGRVEAGESLTREDIVRPLREDQRELQMQGRVERLRRMGPEERRAALRRLPPEERRALMETWQKMRAERQGGGFSANVPGAPVAAPPADAAVPVQPEVSPSGTAEAAPPR